ncbi:MAG: ATP-binding cassette domain-containing protein [Bacteroidales bacterium]|nr:ATP-binding cassette domain-containing protein [Bacteroidales bacterium]
MIETKDICYAYSKGQNLSFSDISIKEGEQWLLKGKSGSGKTTLIHLLAGILSPTKGSISINGVLLQNLNQPGLDKFRANNVGLIFQKHVFISSITMFQNVLIPQQLTGIEHNKALINQLFEELNISALARKKPNQLSQGELQRFSIARALVNKPKLVIADEPTSSLDDENCLSFIELIKKTCKEHDATLLIATHDARIESQLKHIIRLN